MNGRLLAVAIHSYSHEDLSTIDDMNDSMLDQIEQFFVSYNKLRGKKFKVKGRGGPKRAVSTIKDGIRAYLKEHP